MSEREKFGDVDVEKHRGIFGAECAGLCAALDEHEAQPKQASQEGLVVQFDCARCGSRKVMVIEWPEILAMAHGVPPAFAYQRAPQGLMRGAPLDWKWDAQEQVWWPSLPCSNCSRPLLVALSPTDVSQSVQAAKARQMIPPQMEQVCGQLCAGATQALRQQMRR